MSNPFNTKMVDLQTQYQEIKSEILPAVEALMESSSFIKGPAVQDFENKLADFLGVAHVIGCANGTDAIQLSLMALELEPGSEVLVPDFTFIATAEVVALMGLTPVFVDVDMDDFNISVEDLKSKITPKTRAIMPVHLFGQSADMDAINAIAKANGLVVIEDNAQAIGTTYANGQKTGTLGDIGTTSFFPSKNLGAYGDGGAITTNNDELAEKIRTLANHGMRRRYYHDLIGINSRLDSIQAAILDIKLKRLPSYIERRQEAAAVYDGNLNNHSSVQIPLRREYSDHTFHQYTLRILDGKRDRVKESLQAASIPFGIYYPVPLHRQVAFSADNLASNTPNSVQLCDEVISLPMHTELRKDEQDFICERILTALK